MKKIRFQAEYDLNSQSLRQIETALACGQYSIDIENNKVFLVLNQDTEKESIVKNQKPLYESDLVDFASKKDVPLAKKRIYRTDKSSLDRPDLPPQASANRTKKPANLRLTEDYLKAVDHAANEEGLSRTEWLTNLIAKELDLDN